MDISSVVISRDCPLAVQALAREDEDLSVLGNLIEDVKALLNASPNILVHHAHRTTNFVAHRP